MAGSVVRRSGVWVPLFQQPASFGLTRVSLSYPGLALGDVVLYERIERQSHSNKKPNDNGSNYESLQLGGGLVASQDVLRLESRGLGLFLETTGNPPICLTQVFAA